MLMQARHIVQDNSEHFDTDIQAGVYGQANPSKRWGLGQE